MLSWAVGNDGQIYHTNGGGLWTSVATEGTGLEGVTAIDSTHAVVVGDGSQVFYTTNGTTFTAATVPGSIGSETLTDVSFGFLVPFLLYLAQQAVGAPSAGRAQPSVRPWPSAPAWTRIAILPAWAFSYIFWWASATPSHGSASDSTGLIFFSMISWLAAVAWKALAE